MEAKTLVKKKKFEKEINKNLTLKAWVWDIITYVIQEGKVVELCHKRQLEIYDIWNFKDWRCSDGKIYNRGF